MQEQAVDVRRRMQQVGERTKGIFSSSSLKAEPKYLSMLQEMAIAVGKTAEEMESIWRGASAAAHGKGWFQNVAYTAEIGEEYEPGYFRVRLQPRPEGVTTVITTAVDMAQRALVRLLLLCGHDAKHLYARALLSTAEEQPVKRGLEREHAMLVEQYRQRLTDGAPELPS
jgi:hypothetical protein